MQALERNQMQIRLCYFTPVSPEQLNSSEPQDPHVGKRDKYLLPRGSESLNNMTCTERLAQTPISWWWLYTKDVRARRGLSYYQWTLVSHTAPTLAWTPER